MTLSVGHATFKYNTVFTFAKHALFEKKQKHNLHVSVKTLLQHMGGLCCIPSSVFSIHNFSLPGFTVNGNAPIVNKSSSLPDAAQSRISRGRAGPEICTNTLFEIKFQLMSSSQGFQVSDVAVQIDSCCHLLV